MIKFYLMKRLHELREEKGLTQIELATALNIKQSAISTWENGVNYPHIEIIMQIAEFFGVSIDYLIGRSDDFGNIQGQKEELTPNQRKLLEMYNELSPEGKEKVLEYADMVKGDEERKKVPHGGIFGKQRA